VRTTLIKTNWRLQAALPKQAKRALDALLSGLALLGLLPLFGVIAALIKLEDGGPILFWQTRVGKHGRHFAFPKFRSMVVDAEARLEAIRARNQHGATITFKMQDDPRITRIGKVLRRFSMDELPQLWCVFRGDMSLVGPRPALPKEVARYDLSARRRLNAIPGLTCVWQVSGRSNLAFPIQCEMDIAYIRQQSLRYDIELLARTIPAVVSGKGAY
jgi:lipopolysaccharide/colanic/teichoic acid biosynthesis glycosyltransferase